jgi:hypothetical protein
MRKGQFKKQDINEIRECTNCNKEKIVTEFVKGKGCLYRYTCKICDAKRRRKKNPNFETRFKKGQGAKNPFPKGHIPWSKLNKGKYKHESMRVGTGYGCVKYQEWSKAVKERDGKCLECGSVNKLESHHILDFKKYPEKGFDLENGATLCMSCHVKITRMLNKLKNAIIIWQRS